MTHKILLLLICILLSSCGQIPAQTTIPSPTQTVSQSSTPTLTPAPTNTPTPNQTSTPGVSVVTYIVQEGDTLWGIALMFGVTVSQIAQKNSISADSWVYPNQILIIPDPREPLATTEPTNKRIEVILSQQMAYAYEGDVLIREFLVSTGVPAFPTIQGIFSIYAKLESTRMTGPDYDLDHVPWTMYFFEGYGFHGTYWHSNFGHPMSHGCINMKTEDAEWLYNWAPIGTSVQIYP